MDPSFVYLVHVCIYRNFLCGGVSVPISCVLFSSASELFMAMDGIFASVPPPQACAGKGCDF